MQINTQQERFKGLKGGNLIKFNAIKQMIAKAKRLGCLQVRSCLEFQVEIAHLQAGERCVRADSLHYLSGSNKLLLSSSYAMHQIVFNH